MALAIGLAGAVVGALIHHLATEISHLAITLLLVTLEPLVLDVVIEKVVRGPVVVVRNKVTSLWNCQVAEILGLAPVTTNCCRWVTVPINLA